jgi:hypothetical protein
MIKYRPVNMPFQLQTGILKAVRVLVREPSLPVRSLQQQQHLQAKSLIQEFNFL